MFDRDTGIEVRVKPYGSQDKYLEYEAKSTSKLFAEGRNEAFIEAVTDERFEIEVTVGKLFPWGISKTIMADVLIDGVINRRAFLRRPKDGETVTKQVNDFVNFVKGVRSQCGFLFASSEAVDDPGFLTGEEESSELSRRGKIVVTIQRVNAKRKKITKAESWAEEDENDEKLQLPIQTSKKVAVKKGRSHFAQQKVLQPLAELKPSTDCMTHWIPAKGEAGNEIQFTFWYTSRLYLEIQGIVSMITRPNTLEDAVDVEKHVCSQPSLPDLRQDTVASAPREHTGNGGKRIKLGDSTSQGNGQGEHSKFKDPFGHFDDQGRSVTSEDTHDRESLPHKPVRRDENMGLYNTPPGRHATERVACGRTQQDQVRYPSLRHSRMRIGKRRSLRGSRRSSRTG